LTDAAFRALARSAAMRYPANDRFAVHFANGKLTGDPVFAHLIASQLIPAGKRVLDLGCGQGLLAALLDAPGRPSARFHGIDLRKRDIARARAAVPQGEWVEGDIRSAEFPASDVVVILDVLHYIDIAAQDAVLDRVRAALGARGRLLLRIGDQSARRGFRASQWVDAVVTFVRGHRVTPVFGRPLADWVARLEALGFAVHAQPMSQGTPFANVLLVADLVPPGAAAR